jgi:Flp pilus assembly protein TadG
MPPRRRVLRRFLTSSRGVAAIEFGFTFPVLLVMLLASIDAGRAIAISMKVRSASYAVDAMTNQYRISIDDNTMQTILGAAAKVLAPYPAAVGGPATVKLTQIKIDSSGNPTVVWSDGYNTTGYTVGSPPPFSLPTQWTATSVPNNACSSYPCYVLLGEVGYTYTPMFGSFITGPINLADKVYLTPRSLKCIQRNSIPATC